MEITESRAPSMDTPSFPERVIEQLCIAKPRALFALTPTVNPWRIVRPRSVRPVDPLASMTAPAKLALRMHDRTGALFCASGVGG